MELASDLGTMNIDAEKIRDSLNHLLLNAIKFTPDRGSISLKAYRSNDGVVIDISDTGSGIPPEVLPRIFEPFFTTKALSVRRGTGLGLSMVYELAKKMEAGLAVESIVDEGSTFTLFLPVQPSRAESPGESKRPRKGQHEPSESISEAQAPSR